MNGELTELLNELDKRFIAFTSKMEERWKNHDVNSRDRWLTVDGKHTKNTQQIEGIFKRIDDIRGLKREVELHRTLIVMVIIGGIVLGVWIRLTV